MEAKFKPRLEAWEFGILPINLLTPSLETLRSLHELHAALSGDASTEGLVPTSRVGEELDMNGPQLQLLLDSLDSLADGPFNVDNQRFAAVSLPSLLLFLALQLYGKEVPRPEATDHWPDPASSAASAAAAAMAAAAASGSVPSTSAFDCYSPTRAALPAVSPAGGKSPHRQNSLQLRHSSSGCSTSYRGLGDYLKRHLRRLLLLLLDDAGPSRREVAGAGNGGPRLRRDGEGSWPQLDPPTSALHRGDTSSASSGGNADDGSGGAVEMMDAESERAPVTISAREFNRLALLVERQLPPGAHFRRLGSSGGGGSSVSKLGAASRPPLSAAVPLFQAGGAAADAQIAATSPERPATAAAESPLSDSEARVPLDDVVAWLGRNWHEEVAESPTAGPALSNGLTSIRINTARGVMTSAGGVVDDRSLHGLHRGTVVRGESDLPSGELSITDCHDVVIYILAPLRRCMVSGCGECTIVLGAVGGMLRVERCEKTQLIAAASACCIGSCHDCTLYLGVNKAPYLIGDNRFITLAPHNTRYERVISHLGQAGVRLDLPNAWDNPLVINTQDRRLSSAGAGSSPRAATAPSPFTAATSLGGSPALGGTAAGLGPRLGPVTLMPPGDFLPFVVPFKGGPGPLAGGSASAQTTTWSPSCHKQPVGPLPPFPFPLPPEYDEALQAKYGNVSNMKAKIKSAVLDEGRRKELQSVIQSYFREWLSTRPELRHIHDLSKLTDAEGEGH